MSLVELYFVLASSHHQSFKPGRPKNHFLHDYESDPRLRGGSRIHTSQSLSSPFYIIFIIIFYFSPPFPFGSPPPLSNQMIKYNPTHLKCAGYTNMRPATHQNQASIQKSEDCSSGKIESPSTEEVQFSNFATKIKKSRYRQGANSRLCGNIMQLYIHLKYSETVNKHVNACKVCGNMVYSKCSIFGV